MITARLRPLALQLDVDVVHLLWPEYLFMSIPADSNACLTHLEMVPLDTGLNGLTYNLPVTASVPLATVSSIS